MLPTLNWKRKYADEKLRLLSILANRILVNNKVPSQKLSGNFYWDVPLKFSHMLSDFYNPGRTFMVNSLTINEKMCESSVQLVELFSETNPNARNRRLLENGEYRLLENTNYYRLLQ